MGINLCLLPKGKSQSRKELAAPFEGYAKKALLQLKHGTQAALGHSSSKHVPSKHGQEAQLAPLSLSKPVAAVGAASLRASGSSRSRMPAASLRAALGLLAAALRVAWHQRAASHGSSAALPQLRSSPPKRREGAQS